MRIGSLEFSPGRWPTLVTLVMFGFLLSLGFWQLDRAEQKKALLTRYDGGQEQAVLQLEAELKSATGLNYHSAVVAGHYDNRHQFLLDNRTHAGQAGYQILTPFVIRDSGVAVLVNRGWVPLGQSRDQFPDVDVSEHRQQISGRIKIPPEKVFMLAEEEPRQRWPWRIQQVRINALSTELGQPLLPVVLLLDAGEAEGYVRQWRPAAGFGPERNVGYAVQWFGLAITLLIIYLVVNTRRVKRNTSAS
ncbi:Cytochrome oxidase biogenesis protein Surf1, facilitates heme A insertion [hydrothermal vent metagenome]|uniref:Cytochrome oxidase biogenesis protein Surf1, facilitates heme A insertion n=1 Tax=hydrothermal vent metagenome TaxID=652676 RepID=A0A3B0YH20_9ZZZZ